MRLFVAEKRFKEDVHYCFFRLFGLIEVMGQTLLY